MGVLSDLAGAMLTDATPEERSRVLRLMFRIVVAVHILWACGLLAPMGLDGFVFADDVDPKIQSALEPVRSQLGAIQAQLDKGEAIQKRILSGQLAAQFRDLNKLKCSTTDEHSKMRMERELDEAQAEYRTLTGERYPLTPCRDLDE